jgi:flagellar assembly protein FliH
MRSVKTIQLPQALLSVILVGQAPVEEAPKFSDADLEAARREGYQRGFQDASAVIETQLVEQRHEVAHLQQKTFQALTGQHDALVRQLREAMPELTMDIVRRILGGMEPDQAAVVRIVNEVLQTIAPGPETIEVCLSQQDLKLVESYEAGFRERYPQIQFRADPDLEPGDCTVASRFGSLDGRLTTKLRSVDRLLQ